MAISRVKVWSAGEVLTAADLNAEFNNILNNAADLLSPLTKAISMAGFALHFDAANSISLSAVANGLSLSGGAFNTPQGADIPSAATLNLDTATGNLVDVTGTTGITAITLSQGRERVVRFTGSLLLTNGASLVLPDSANIQTAAGDYAIFRGYAAGVVRCVGFFRLNQKGSDVASAGTVNLDTTTGEIVDITGTTTITAITLASGRRRLVRFTGALTLTNGASLVLPGNADILTVSGDMAIVTGYAAGVVRVSYFKNLRPTNQPIIAIAFVIEGGGTTITTGVKGDLRIPFACTINSVTLLADQSGSIVVDIWKDTYANYPPTVADTITSATPPTISTATKSEDTTLSGWVTSIAADDTLRFNVNSVTTIQRCVLILKVTKL